ncbi:hypothetical protein [Clostridium polynesiense]|uniref:hypothetical protein n=1 Tax=Clostridium polynesiense TaxID=1325933 RepID=UPI00058CD9F0|nr:hypothetical protein [Clostridium polynesiense]
MSIVSYLESKKQTYMTQIVNARSQIKKCERSYDSLSIFKSTVTKSQEDFHTINSNKSKILSDVVNVKKNSITAERYYGGMHNILSGIGPKVVGVVYAALLASISVKLRNYRNKIDFYEGKIDDYQRKIADLERQIEEANKTDELSKWIMRGGL